MPNQLMSILQGGIYQLISSFKESESAAYGNHKSVPQSSVSVTSSAVKENSNYETIPYDSGRNVHGMLK